MDLRLAGSAERSCNNLVSFWAGLRCRLGTSASVSSAGRNLWLFGIWLEHVLKNIPFHDRYKEFTDELTHAHVAELCLER